MNQKQRIQIAVLVIAIVAVAVLGSLGYRLFASRPPHIIPPDLGPDASGDHTQSSSGALQQIEVTVDTVQAVIASLDRADSYYRQLSVETFWQGGSGTTSVQTWVDGEYTYVRSTSPSGQVRHCLSERDTVYYWYSGSSTWFTAPADTLSADLSQRIPTYEDVLALDISKISNAGFEAYGKLPCIFVETQLDEFGYVERYWISTDSGLLVAAQTLKDDQVVYRLSATSPIQTPCPTDVVFILPDGSVLHSF